MTKNKPIANAKKSTAPKPTFEPFLMPTEHGYRKDRKPEIQAKLTDGETWFRKQSAVAERISSVIIECDGDMWMSDYRDLLGLLRELQNVGELIEAVRNGGRGVMTADEDNLH